MMKAVMYLTCQTSLVVEMNEREVKHPYVYKPTDIATAGNNGAAIVAATLSKHIFTLLYSKLDALLANIYITHKVANLPRRSITKVEEELLLAPLLVPRLTNTFGTSLLVDSASGYCF